MKLSYTEPEMEVIFLTRTEIVATSNTDKFEVPGDFGEEGTDWE